VRTGAPGAEEAVVGDRPNSVSKPEKLPEPENTERPICEKCRLDPELAKEKHIPLHRYLGSSRSGPSLRGC
jgi:hypothetical protein